MSLHGRRVLVTRAAEDAADLCCAIEARGGVAVCLPTIRREVPDDDSALKAAVEALPQLDGLAIGAVTAVRPLAAYAAEPVHGVVGCVGARTAHRIATDPVLSKWLRGPRVVPAVFRAEALVDALKTHFGGSLAGFRFCVPRAPEGRPALVDSLRAEGATVDDVITYRIRPASPPSADLWQRAQDVDIALFMSGQTLENLIAITPNGRAMLDRVVVGVIGPVAEQRAQALGVRVDVMPAVASQSALLDAVEAHLALSAGSDS